VGNSLGFILSSLFFSGFFSFLCLGLGLDDGLFSSSLSSFNCLLSSVLGSINSSLSSGLGVLFLLGLSFFGSGSLFGLAH
jgi:hypothetical protein